MSSASTSASGSVASVGSTVFGVWTYYNDSACTASPLSIELEPHSTCLNDLSMTDGGCLAVKSSKPTGLYSTTKCTTDIVSAIESAFATDAVVVGYSVYDGTDCSAYESTSVTIASGGCLLDFNFGSAVAAVESNGSASFQAFYADDCTGTPIAGVTASSYDWGSAPCVAIGSDDESYKFFTSATIDVLLPLSLASISTGATESGSSASDSYWASDSSNVNDGSSGSDNASPSARVSIKASLTAAGVIVAWITM